MPGSTPDEPNEPATRPLPAVGSDGRLLPPEAPQLAVGAGRRTRVAGVVLGGVALAAVAVVGVLLVLGNAGDDEPTPVVNQSTTPADAPTPQEGETGLDLPTIDPSDFPSELPTTSSSDPGPPGEFPSELATSFPSDFAEDFPTDPADLESWFSDYLSEAAR